MLGRHIFGYLPVNAVQGIVSFGIIAVFTRLLLPSEYGRYAIAMAGVQLALGACFYWLHASMGRFYESSARDGRLQHYLASGLFGFAATASAIGFLSGLALLLFARESEFFHVGLAGVSALIARALLMMGLEVARASRDVARYSLLESGQAVLGLALGVVLVLATDLRGAAPLWGITIANGIFVLIDLPRLLRKMGRFTPSAEELKRFARYGLPLSASILLEIVLSSSDRFLVGYFLGDAAVGVYAVGYSLADRTLAILFSWVTMAAVPLTFAALEREGPEAARALCRRNAESLLFIGLPATAGLALVADPLAAVMAGVEFRAAAAAIIPWIALAGLLHGVTLHYLHHSFLFAQRTDLLVWIMAVPSILNVILNVVLIPVLGLNGAVVGTVAAYVVALVLSGIFGHRLFALPIPGRAMAGGLAATAVMAVAVWAVPDIGGVPGLFAKAIVGAAVYAAAALVLDLAGCRSRLRGIVWVQPQ